jgi:uncharacterized protein (DUF58 family)
VLTALSGLTTRGRSFVAAGLAAVACSLALGQQDLLRVGVLLLALPLASVFAVSRTRHRVACTRTLHPARVPAGEQTRIGLRLENVSLLPTGLLLAEDTVPYVLGARPRFVLDRLEPRGHRDVTYRVRSEIRGQFLLGPLTVKLADPFGMCELTRAFRHRDTLIITPVVEPLASVALGGEWSGSGDSHPSSVPAAGEDDVATREYRQGDALHRVHWRSTARHGELMVRREEQPWQSRATIMLDTRAAGHRGDGPASSLEWAVSAAASVGVHLTRNGYSLRLLTDEGPGISGATPDVLSTTADVEGLLLDALAVVTASTSIGVGEATSQLRRAGTDGLLIAILGELTHDEAEQLARLRHGSTTAIAFLLKTGTWEPSAPAWASDLEATFDRNVLLLRSTGWRVVPVSAGDSLRDLWPQAARGGPAAALAGTQPDRATTGAAFAPAGDRP